MLPRHDSWTGEDFLTFYPTKTARPRQSLEQSAARTSAVIDAETMTSNRHIRKFLDMLNNIVRLFPNLRNASKGKQALRRIKCRLLRVFLHIFSLALQCELLISGFGSGP